MSVPKSSNACIPGALLAAFVLVPATATLRGDAKRPMVYPEARRSDQVDDYHGTKIADPYRWLEDADSKESQRWIEAENRLTFGYLGRISARGKIKDRLTELWDYEKFGLPVKRGQRYLFTRNDGLQNQDVLYKASSLEGEPKVLLDPNKLSEDGTVALSGWDATEDGKLLAYGIAEAGSDWQQWRVRDIATGKDLDDLIRWIKFSGASWTKDGRGFFYSRFDEPKGEAALKDANYFQKLYHHRLGARQSDDKLVYERSDHKDWLFDGTVTDDGRYLIISVRKGTERKNQVFYQDLSTADAPVVELIQGFHAQYVFVDNDGPIFWFRTDLDAPLGRLIAIDTRRPEKAHWKEVIPESKATLRSVSAVGNAFIASYLKDARSQVKVFGLDGKFVRELKLPGMGSARGFGGKRSDMETFFSFSSYKTPPTLYRYDIAAGKSLVFRRPKVDFVPDAYETKQVFYKSKDGTKVPMFITHRKGIKLDGNNPTILYGYGGFNIPITPLFKVSTVAWMDMGGVYAAANLRGGGEYGREWHHAGMKLEKQNVFDDFIAAAEWLIAKRYTSTPRLAIAGGSNGGLLVGACMTQRPDLFGACLPAVGVLDMLRFHKFTIGWAWVSDYGSPDNPEEFEALRAYSPLHNVRPGTAYPATMITTADHDDRVFPAHSFKFAAALQAAQSGPAPLLIRIQTKAGHGAGKPTSMKIEEAADSLSFLVSALDMDVH